MKFFILICCLCSQSFAQSLLPPAAGKRLVVYDAFPQLFKDMSKTREEMIAAGLLAEPQMTSI